MGMTHAVFMIKAKSCQLRKRRSGRSSALLFPGYQSPAFLYHIAIAWNRRERNIIAN